MDTRRKMAMAAMILFVLAFYTGRTSGGQGLTNGDFLRFHVIANSDSPEDQELKLKVRDGLLEEIDRGLAVHTMAQAGTEEGRVELTLEQSRAYVRDHLEEIAQAGERIVRTLGYDYDVTAELGPCRIPEKTYGNVTFPEGEYEALNVTIGHGGGQNWWCVLFPPLCLIGAEPAEEKMAADDSQTAREALTMYRNVVWNPKYEPLLKAAQSETPVKLELKFKTLEYLRDLEG